jgi:neutral ceramidase
MNHNIGKKSDAPVDISFNNKLSSKHHFLSLATYLLLILFLLPSFYASALQPGSKSPVQLSVGIGKKNITPDPKVKNWVTGKPYEGVEDSIFVRALILNDGQSDVVLIAWNLVDAGESATDEVRSRISEQLNIPKDQILVNASHNHSAPWAPVYKGGYRGKERDTWWAIRYMPAQNDDKHYKKWMNRLLDQTVEAVQQARTSMQPATLWIGRTDVSEYLNNRRPRFPEWGVEKANTPKGYNYRHEEYNPKVLVGGASYGPMDRAMTLISFRDDAGANIASIFHLSVHAVSIYPFSNAISGDWPQEAAKQITNTLGGEAIFMQGTAGDINPWRRGREAVKKMGAGLADYASLAFKYSAQLEMGNLIAKRGKIALPLTSEGKERTGLSAVQSEVQVLAIGPLAFVTLPGEPLTDLGFEIRERSPFPQTVVLGYSNGNGVHYVGMPGEKARGGYEMEAGTVGTDEAGQMLVNLAVDLLNDVNNQRQ